MDIPIPKKRFTTTRVLIGLGVLALIVFAVYTFKLQGGASKLNVEAERITVSTVTKGAFRENIPVNGIVYPISTIYLDAQEGGRVEEKYVEDGAMMKKGQPILKMSNTDLELNLANQEVAVFNVLTQMQYTKNIAEQNSMNRLNQMADVDNALIEAERVHNLNKKLFEEGAIGKQDYMSSENLFEYQKKRKKLAEDILNQDKSSMSQQIEQATESYRRMTNTLQLMKRKVGDLIVRAPVDGQLTSLDSEIGQSINKGDRLGQLDITSGYKVRADIDEHYISRIFPGQNAEYVTKDKTYILTIKKVYTQVVSGRFQVDMVFEGAAPENIRRGQSLQIRMNLSEETTALLLPRGGFYQKTGGNWIFKLSEDGSTAYKTNIQLNRQSPENYELMEGLSVGDKVITSSYDSFGDVDELVLK